MIFKRHFFIVLTTLLVARTSADKLLLENVELNCCTIAEYPIVSPDKFEKHKYKGLAFDYLQKLENRLGFQCKTMTEYKTNGTSFTQFTKDMQSCVVNPNKKDPLCKCELGVGGWVTTRERIERVLYLPSFLRFETDVLTHVDNTGSSTLGSFFLNAFTPKVWALIGLLFLSFTLLRMMDPRFEQPFREYRPLPANCGKFERAKHFLLKSRLLYRLRKAAFRTAMEMTQQVEPKAGMNRNSTRQWVLMFGVMLVGLFFVLTYEAFMTAYLVEKKFESIYRTADDFRTCNVDVKDICIAKGGAEESYWRNSFAHEPCSNGEMPRFIESYDRVIEKVADKTCTFVMSGNTQTGDALHGKYCSSVIKVGEPVFWGGLSFVMPTNTRRTVFGILRSTTLDIIEQGKITTVEEYYQKKGECFKISNDSLSLPSLRVFFIVAFSFIVFMFCIMILDPQRPPEGEIGEGEDHGEEKLDLQAKGDPYDLGYDESVMSRESDFH